MCVTDAEIQWQCRRNCLNSWVFSLFLNAASDETLTDEGSSLLTQCGAAATRRGHQSSFELSVEQEAQRTWKTGVLNKIYAADKLSIFVRLRNDLYCVEWGVKLYSLTQSTAWFPRYWAFGEREAKNMSRTQFEKFPLKCHSGRIQRQGASCCLPGDQPGGRRGVDREMSRPLSSLCDQRRSATLINRKQQ